jgi:hypothetical protein
MVLVVVLADTVHRLLLGHLVGVTPQAKRRWRWKAVLLTRLLSVLAVHLTRLVKIVLLLGQTLQRLPPLVVGVAVAQIFKPAVVRVAVQEAITPEVLVLLEQRTKDEQAVIVMLLVLVVVVVQITQVVIAQAQVTLV